LVVALSPAGRGQLLTHNLYLPEELSRLKQLLGNRAASAAEESRPSSAYLHAPPSNQLAAASTASTAPLQASAVDSLEELQQLKDEVAELREQVERLTDRLDRLES
jgi:ubiquinone biosynthesis protein UbiJ